MKKEKAIKIFSILAAAFPGLDIPEDTIALWESALLPLEAESGMKAVQEYLLSPGKKFFPTPGEIMEIYDKHELLRRERQRQEDMQAEREATRRLFHGPTSSGPGSFAKKSVELIRDVCAGRVKSGSEEYQQRFRQIYPGVDPRTGV